MFYDIDVSIELRKTYRVEAETAGRAKQQVIKSAMADFGVPRSLVDVRLVSACCQPGKGTCCLEEEE